MLVSFFHFFFIAYLHAAAKNSTSSSFTAQGMNHTSERNTTEQSLQRNRTIDTVNHTSDSNRTEPLLQRNRTIHDTGSDCESCLLQFEFYGGCQCQQAYACDKPNSHFMPQGCDACEYLVVEWCKSRLNTCCSPDCTLESNNQDFCRAEMVKYGCYACGFCTLCDRCPFNTYKDDQGTETVCRCLSNDKVTLDGSDCKEIPWDNLPCELPSRMKLSTEFWYIDLPELQNCDTSDCTEPVIRNVQCNQWLGYFGEVQVSGCTKANRTTILSGCSMGVCNGVFVDTMAAILPGASGVYTIREGFGLLNNRSVYFHRDSPYMIFCSELEMGTSIYSRNATEWLVWDLNYWKDSSFKWPTLIDPGFCDHWLIVQINLDISSRKYEFLHQVAASSAEQRSLVYRRKKGDASAESFPWLAQWSPAECMMTPICEDPSSTISSGGLFSVKGKCEVDGDCATSRNYPKPYGMLEHCEINMLQDADIQNDLFFINIESGYDHFSLDGVGIDSWEGLPSHVDYGQTFRWSSDSMISGSLNSNEDNIGWKICFEKPESSYDENCTYTIDDSENSRSFEITDSEIRIYTEHSILAGVGTFDDGYDAGNLCNRREEVMGDAVSSAHARMGQAESDHDGNEVVVTWLKDPECSQEDNIAVSASSCSFLVSLCPCVGRKKEDCTYNATQVSVPNVRIEISNEEVWYHETVMNLVGKGSYSTGVYTNGDPCSGQHDQTDWGVIQNRRSARIVWMDSTATDCDYVTQDMQCIYSIHICPCNADLGFNFNAVMFGETVVLGLLIISIVSGIVFIYRFVTCCAKQLKTDDHEDVELFDLYQNIIEEQSDCPVDSSFFVTSDSDAPVDSIFPTISDSEGGDNYIDSDFEVSDRIATASLTLDLTDWRQIRDFLHAQQV